MEGIFFLNFFFLFLFFPTDVFAQVSSEPPQSLSDGPSAISPQIWFKARISISSPHSSSESSNNDETKPILFYRFKAI